jgi:hypothetical protein
MRGRVWVGREINREVKAGVGKPSSEGRYRTCRFELFFITDYNGDEGITIREKR